MQETVLGHTTRTWVLIFSYSTVCIVMVFLPSLHLFEQLACIVPAHRGRQD